MFIDIVPNRSSPPAILLRESYRDENGNTKKRTIANLSGLSLEQAHKFKAVLKGAELSATRLENAFEIVSTKPHGHVAAVLGVIDNLGLPALIARGDTEQRRNVLALVAGRIISPGSKLALSRNLTGAASTLGEDLALSPDLTEDDLYSAMRWLGDRQQDIEKRLAAKHLQEGSVVLYDLSSSYYEGSKCSLAKFGHNRDGKRGRTQINYGVLTTAEGCPVAIEVYPGNVGDPSTVADQLHKIRQRFGIKKAIVVGDRGMLTTAQLDIAASDPELADYSWITALRSSQIENLLKNGDISPDLFDQRNLVEISSEDYPGERLIVCRNPRLAQERKRKRIELLATTETALKTIAEACQRVRNPYHGKDKIGARVQREVAKYKMLKHFEITITETSLTYQRNEAGIKEESELDGFYVIRARQIAKEEMTDTQIVETYKKLGDVERVFRAMKTTSLQVRPIFHRLEEMVKAHLFVCLLAYYVQWHMERKLAPLLYRDEALREQKARRESPVDPTQRSEKAAAKASRKQTEDGLVVHSFRSLMDELAGISRVVCRPILEGAQNFVKKPILSGLQEAAFNYLGVKFGK
jgi:transposase